MKRSYTIFLLISFLFLNTEIVEATSVGLSIGVHDTTGFFSTTTFNGDLCAEAISGRFSELGIPSLPRTIDSDTNSYTDIDIKNLIESTASSLQTGDNMYLYLTGHGIEHDAALKIGDLGYVLDKYSLNASELEEYLSPYENINKFIYVDSCYGGAFWDSGLKNLDNIFFIAAADAEHQTAFTVDGVTWSSLAIMSGLKYNPDPSSYSPYGSQTLFMDEDNNGIVTPIEFKDFVTKKINQYRMQPGYDEFGNPIYFEAEFGDPINPADIGTPVMHISPDMAFEINYGVPESAPVPEPTTFLLLGMGLIGLAGVNRKKLKTTKR